MRSHSLTTPKGVASGLYNARAGGSLDGSRIYIGNNGTSLAEVKICNSLSHEVVGMPNQYVEAVSVSSNASRVIVQNVDAQPCAVPDRSSPH